MAEGAGNAGQRLFVGVPLPAELQAFVRRAQESLPPACGLRLLRPEQLHVTLAFIGEVDAERAAVALNVVERLPFQMGGEATIDRFLFLPSRSRAKVVSLGLADEKRVLARLFERVADGLEAGGVMKREKRPFRAHLTIARLSTPSVVRLRYESGQARFAVESVCLYMSELRREGAVYTVVYRRSFGRGDAEERV